ncbi:ribosome maturation factor RimP [Streptomyces rubellomurinus]|uniref:Ribosome maturation factor RimP n=2 Tax=Streptomyces TaxID=1883 RepID=A0A0F2T6J4_STRR3|nr:ribosome maturation factor RimP [Streptomyces rubellomurinus]KJS54340.1 ribosome maturation protein RimP [Streptomyces rubellomurinus subsp. indigoferus]KJS58854.1 ribosome maturation protein RimP [Streptomyces rubellomurinus]
MSTTHTDRLRALLEPLATQAGLDLEDVRVTKAGNRRQVQIDVDTDEGVDMDAVAEFSRVVGEALDASDVMGEEPYLLEVGSPGAERPLALPRHWHRAEGRLAAIHLVDGGELVARVLAADEDGALVEVQPVKGRGRPKERRLEYTEVARARVQVEFNRKDDDDLLDEEDGGDDGAQ